MCSRGTDAAGPGLVEHPAQERPRVLRPGDAADSPRVDRPGPPRLRPTRPGANHASASGSPDQPEKTHDPDDLDEWTDIHRQIELLPEEEREVVGLLFYQGLPQADAAAVLDVTVRTVQRRWHATLIRLHHALKDETTAS